MAHSSLGRGRLIRQKMFGPMGLRRSSLPNRRFGVVDANYFFGLTPPTPPGTNQNWPWTVTQIAFQTDPFNSSAELLYQDVSSRSQGLNTARGRQYELDTISAGESTLTFVDPDEALNPTNPMSPYYPGVKVYRRILDQVMWPPTSAQVTATQLNTNSTFEVGAVPWVAIGNATAARSTVLSHSGFASLLTTPDGVTSNPGCVSELMTAYPNVNYTVNGWLATPNSGAITRHLQIVWYDSNGALLFQNEALAVNATALNANPFFETNVLNWTPVGCTIVRDVTVAHTGSASMKMTPDGINTTPHVECDQAPVTAGSSYLASGWLYSPGGYAAGGGVRINWYDSGHVYLSTSSADVAIPAGLWVQHNNLFTAPASAAFAGIHIAEIGTPPVGAILNADEVILSLSGVSVPGASTWVQANGMFLSPPNVAFMQIESVAFGAVTEPWYLDDVTITPTSGVNLINLAGGGLSTGYDFGIDPTFEIFPVGTTLSFYDSFGGAGTTSVQSAVPFTGNRYLECVLVPANLSPQGIVVSLICIPGVTYTWSAFVMIDTGSTTVQLQLGNNQFGSTLIPFSYVRMALTFQATSNIHTLYVQTVGTINSGKLRIDNVQFEQGPVATAFTAYGPTIYGVFSGFVERWPVSWNYSGTYGMSSITCVDALAILANQSIYGEIRNETLFQAPAYYWPLDDGQGATFFGEKSGNAGPELTVINAINGAGTVTAGSSVKITGDPGGTAVQIAGGTAGTNTAGSTLQTVPGTSLTIGGSGASWGISGQINVIIPISVAGPIFMLADPLDRFFLSIELDGAATPGIIGKLITPLGTFTTTNVGTSEGVIELEYFITMQISGGNTTISVQSPFDSINNTFTGSNTSVWGTASPTINFTTLYLGGRLNSYTQIIGPQTTYSHVALWNRVLGGGDINRLTLAAEFGFGNENPGDRINRYVNYANLPGGTSLDGGASLMTAAAVGGNGGTSALDAIQNVAISDNGTFYVDENGVATFQSRLTRYLTTVPGWTFGENQAAGEIPYVEGITYDYDATQVYNDIKCSRVSGITVFNDNGITAVGGTSSEIAASRRRYGTKSLTRDLNITSDLETQDAANWLFAAHKDPVQRIAQLSIEPSSNPLSWYAALGIRIGDRVTVRRRTKQYSAFNQVGNFTMSAEYFVERVEHSREPGRWRVTYQMSPVGGAAGLQPWILEHQKYGVLNQTTLLGY